MQESLADVLSKYADSNAIRFHMPGHNGTRLDIDTSMDITELSFSDNLLSAHGIISNTERLIARAYNTNYALMLTCGATSGVAIALRVALLHGDSIAVVGNAHKSVYNYANIFSLKVIQIESEEDLINIPNLSAVIITSPDYFGEVTDHSRYTGNHLLIIDQSHGAHFAFSSELPAPSTDADILITSWHKTLPVLTGGAVVTCQDDNIYSELLSSREMLHTSSPSYITMSSMDTCVRLMAKDGEQLYHQVIMAVDEFVSNLSDKYDYIASSDRTRLVISLKGMSASALSSVLENYGIYVEMSYEDKLVCIITPYNYQHLARFNEVLSQLTLDNSLTITPTFELSHSDSYSESQGRLVHILDSVGMVCMTSVGMYPPGVPIIIKGQIITKEIITHLHKNINNTFGLISGKILAAENY